MTVLTVGLIAIALYGVVLAIWLRVDQNRSEYVVNRAEEKR